MYVWLAGLFISNIFRKAMRKRLWVQGECYWDCCLNHQRNTRSCSKSLAHLSIKNLDLSLKEMPAFIMHLLCIMIVGVRQESICSMPVTKSELFGVQQDLKAVLTSSSLLKSINDLVPQVTEIWYSNISCSSREIFFKWTSWSFSIRDPN